MQLALSYPKNVQFFFWKTIDFGNLEMTQMARMEGVMLFASIWRNAFENRYVIYLLVKIRSMQEPCLLKQVFPLIKFIIPLTLIKFFMMLSWGWALKSPIIIKLSYELEKKLIIPLKKSIIPVKDSTNRACEFKGAISILLITFLRLNSR